MTLSAILVGIVASSAIALLTILAEDSIDAPQKATPKAPAPEPIPDWEHLVLQRGGSENLRTVYRTAEISDLVRILKSYPQSTVQLSAQQPNEQKISIETSSHHGGQQSKMVDSLLAEAIASASPHSKGKDQAE